MTVVWTTSYHQNVTYPYLIDCGTVQYIVPHSIEQSVISLLSIINVKKLLFYNNV